MKITFLCFILAPLVIAGQIYVKSGFFDLSNNLVPLDKILSGGVPKDGTPAILEPDHLSVKEASVFLKDNDRVLGLAVNGDSKAYPVKILSWHEVVNDQIDKMPVLVTYCPLCGTGLAFIRSYGGRELMFGVSGLLYNSDLLMYDHETESLWSQIEGRAITGRMSGTRLGKLSLLTTTWGYWKTKYPETKVALPRLGYMRSYEADAYKGYAKSDELMFPVNRVDRRLHSKAMVIGARIGKASKAYPFSELSKLDMPFTDVVGGRKIRIEFDRKTETANITGLDGGTVDFIVGYWFAWFAFNPETDLYMADKTDSR